MRWIFGLLMAIAVWMASAIENRFLTGAWAQWVCMSVTVLLWGCLAYILWREHDEARKKERKRLRTSQRMADEEKRMAYLRETMAA